MTPDGRRSRAPDLLTALRIALLPVLLWLLARVRSPEPLDPTRLAAVGTYLAMGLSDLLDGLLARRLGVSSDRGALLDAAADKLVVLAPLFYLALARPAPFPPVPLWLPGSILVLDAVLVTSLLRARRGGGEAPGEARHSQAGRAATLVAFLLVGGVVAGVPAVLVAPAGVLLVGLRLFAVVGYLRRWRLSPG